MPKKLFKTISLLIAIVLIFAPMQNAFAGLIDDGTPYKLIVHNRVSATDLTHPSSVQCESFSLQHHER